MGRWDKQEVEFYRRWVKFYDSGVLIGRLINASVAGLYEIAPHLEEVHSSLMLTHNGSLRDLDKVLLESGNGKNLRVKLLLMSGLRPRETDRLLDRRIFHQSSRNGKKMLFWLNRDEIILCAALLQTSHSLLDSEILDSAPTNENGWFEYAQEITVSELLLPEDLSSDGSFFQYGKLHWNFDDSKFPTLWSELKVGVTRLYLPGLVELSIWGSRNQYPDEKWQSYLTLMGTAYMGLPSSTCYTVSRPHLCSNSDLRIHKMIWIDQDVIENQHLLRAYTQMFSPNVEELTITDYGVTFKYPLNKRRIIPLLRSTKTKIQ